MRLTKLGHSCVRLDKDGTTLVIDPGGWSDPAAALDGAAAVLVTHEHPDHLDADAIRAALSSDPGVTLWANQSICAQFVEFGDRVHEVKHGDALQVAGFDVHVYGVDHALIHPDIPLVVNTGFHPVDVVLRQAGAAPRALHDLARGHHPARHGPIRPSMTSAMSSL